MIRTQARTLDSTYYQFLWGDDVQAAVDAVNAAGGGTLVIDGDISLATTLTLKSNVRMVIRGSIIWDGATDGTVIASADDSVLGRAGIICDGGLIDMADAGIGIDLHSHQFCKFDLLFTGDSLTSIAFKSVADSSTATGSITGTKNTGTNEHPRIVHLNQCGKLIYMAGEASGASVNTLNNFGLCRAAYAAVAGIEFGNWCDTNHFYGLVNLRINGTGGIGIKTYDHAACYYLTFEHVSLGMYGDPMGRVGVYVGADVRHLKIKSLFCDGNNLDADEGGFVSAHANAVSYLVEKLSLNTGGGQIRQLSKGFHVNARRVLADNILGEEKFAIADDDVYSFTPPETRCDLLISSNTVNAACLIYCRAEPSPETGKLGGNAFVEVTTGVLSPGDGTNDRFTVSTASDGKIYFSNRLGSPISICITVLSGHSA